MAVLTLVSAACVQAQEVSAAVAAGTGPQPRLWLEPRVSVGLTLSSNGGLSSSNRHSEQTIEIRPGVRAVMNSQRVKGFLDYSLSSLVYLQNTSRDNHRHSLNGNATVNAWNNQAFIDLSAAVSSQAVSAFGIPVGSSLADENRSETASFRFSPYIRGNLASVADYQLRYSLQKSSTAAASRSDITSQDLFLHLGSRNTGQKLGWTLDASTEAVDYSLTRDTRSDRVNAGLVYFMSPQLRWTLLAGREANNVISPTRESYNTSGLNAEWRPSPRTRLFAEVENRYFGRGHNVALEHRTGRTVWRYADTRKASTGALQAASASLGSIYDLLDSLYISVEPDPIKRAQLVQAELLQLGLPPDAQVFQSFLTSSATLDRRQELSLVLLGVRSAVTFSVFRSNSRRLDSAITLGDDFDTNASIRQQGWRVDVAHRLTPITSVNASLSIKETQGSSSASEISTKALSLGASTRLSLRTSGSVELRHTVSDGSLRSYNETAVVGLVTHRF